MSEVYFKNVNALKGPVLALLRKDGYQAVDMHYHTKFSVDGLATIKTVLNKCTEDSIGIAVTDHNNWRGSQQAGKINHEKVFIIPGIEVTCHTGAHVLLHFYDSRGLRSFYEQEMERWVKESPWFIRLSHEEIIERASKYNCLITVPHPFGPGLIGIKRFNPKSETMKKVHAIEVINGCCLNEMNTQAIHWAKQLDKGFTGGSDGHCLAELGTSLTICKADTVEEFLNQVKKKRSMVIGKEERLLDDAVHAMGKFVREEEKAPSKELEEMWRDRGLLEWNLFKKKIFGGSWFHHFHAHHQAPNKAVLREHEQTKHLLEHMK